MNNQTYLDVYTTIFNLYQKHYPEMTGSDISQHAIEFAEKFANAKEINLNPIKPSWNDAPSWANWLAMDKDGKWYWYKYEPIKDCNLWYSAYYIDVTYSSKVLQLDNVKENNAIFFNWEESLEQRPE